MAVLPAKRKLLTGNNRKSAPGNNNNFQEVVVVVVWGIEEEEDKNSKRELRKEKWSSSKCTATNSWAVCSAYLKPEKQPTLQGDPWVWIIFLLMNQENFSKEKFEFPAASELAATTSQRCAKWSS